MDIKLQKNRIVISTRMEHHYEYGTLHYITLHYITLHYKLFKVA